MANISVEKMVELMVTYLVRQYPKKIHVHRVAAWLGYISGGIEKVATRLERKYVRQFDFMVHGVWYRLHFAHKAGPRGGMVIDDCLGERVVTITCLDDARRFYDDPHQYFRTLRVAA